MTRATGRGQVSCLAYVPCIRDAIIMLAYDNFNTI